MDPVDVRWQLLIDRYAAAARQEAMYREMLDVARRYANEFEIERCEADIAEWQEIIDQTIEDAIIVGMGPDDLASGLPAHD